ncbi:hypothetical protein Trydic_g23366 [Trypoxylus dichotomus]
MMTGKVFIISIHFVTMVTATRAIRDPTEKKATVLGPLERDQGFCKIVCDKIEDVLDEFVSISINHAAKSVFSGYQDENH